MTGMLLEEILFNAGIEKRPPPSPKGGIPKQWFPAFLRWPLRLMVLPFVWLDVFSQKIARWVIRPPYKMTGKCKKRGNCCHYIMIQHWRGPLGWLNLFWQTQLNGFYKRDPNVYLHGKKLVYVMGCRYLSKEGKCTKYFFRPTVCRTWPRIELFGEPEVLKGCGFKAELKKKRSKNSKLPIL